MSPADLSIGSRRLARIVEPLEKPGDRHVQLRCKSAEPIRAYTGQPLLILPNVLRADTHRTCQIFRAHPEHEAPQFEPVADMNIDIARQAGIRLAMICYLSVPLNANQNLRLGK